MIPPKDSDSPDSAAVDAGHKLDSYRPGATAPFCLVTHFTQTSEDFPYIASKNHRAYAQAHGYGQNTYTGRISGAQFLNLSKGDISQVVGGGLYWQKITAVKSTLDEMVEGSQLRRYAWVMWLDADIIITHKARSLTEVLQQAIDSAAQASHESTHVILSSDASGPVNAGAFLIRNSPEGRAFIDTVAAMHPLFKDIPLQDQPAMTAAAFINETQPNQPCRIAVHPHMVIAPQRIFNSFVNLGPRYKIHPENVAWQLGDFAAHYAGVNVFRRALLMQQMLDDVRAWERQKT